MKPSAVLFEAEIGKYTEIANNLQIQETFATVNFLNINSDQLKNAIIEHCVEWQNKLTLLLLRMTQELVEQLNVYMEENIKK